MLRARGEKSRVPNDCSCTLDFTLSAASIPLVSLTAISISPMICYVLLNAMRVNLSREVRHVCSKVCVWQDQSKTTLPEYI